MTRSNLNTAETIRNCQPSNFAKKSGLTFPPLMTIFLFIPLQFEGRCQGRLLARGGMAAPAGAGRTSPRAIGRFWVTVRAHYGALPSMAGRGTDEGGRKPVRAEAFAGFSRSRKYGPNTKNRRGGASEDVSVASGFRFRKSCCGPTQQGASFGAPPPSFSREKLNHPFTQHHLRAAMTLGRTRCNA